LPTAYQWAERLAKGPTLALAMTKRMVTNEWNMDLLAAIEAEAQAQALLLMGEDHRLFYETFLEKARPTFTGR
jgi:enoyl-CoA hydratase/carnithine racemase